MTRPHNTSDEAPELTGSEKEKVMNDFLLNRINDGPIRFESNFDQPKSWVEEKFMAHSNTISNDLSTKTRHELLTYKLALAVAFKKCGGITSQTGRALRAIYLIVEQAEKDALFEGQQLPWKD